MQDPAPSRAYLLLWLIASFMLVATGCTADALLDGDQASSLPNGVTAGDVGQTSAVLWARVTAEGPVTFTVGTETVPESIQVAAMVTDPMRPITVTITDLSPATAYQYTVATSDGHTTDGVFRTAAMPQIYHGLRFGVSGDWRGSLAPFVALRNAPACDLDFFVALGDTIYADLPSPALQAPRAETLADFRRKHADVYSARFGLNTLVDLRASAPLFATIDDHEILNDIAGGAQAADDPRIPETSGRINQSALYRNALEAFQAYNPIRQEQYGIVGGDGRMDGAPRLYRYRLFGRDAALFLLDARSFRDLPVRRADRNDPADVARFRADTFRTGRTMLGAQQLADLKRDLLDAQAQGITWKFIMLPEPIQHRGLMSAQDRFEGYAAERTDLLQFIVDNAIPNVLFVAADIHGTLVNNITYSMGPETSQIPTQAFEVTVGPVAYAPTLGPVVIIDGLNKGYVTVQEQAAYESLPAAPDADDRPDDRDDYVRAILDRELVEGGYDPIGLDGAPIDATLLQGDYVALHTYGWTEFVVDQETQLLTVTTYGIPAYTETDLVVRPFEVLGSAPQVVSQFAVTPKQ